MTPDEKFMLHAIRLALRGLGRVEPNPPVGCVIVKNNRIIAQGWHKRFGGPHAEVHALQAAGPRARGATMYVTLEPCKHFGKTPPCTHAVLKAGIKRLVIGAPDPYKTAGGGGAKLRHAGLKVDLGICSAEAQQLIAPYKKLITTRLPFVIAKWASTLDGSLALPPGQGRWISSKKSRHLVHQLRGRIDAVMVGIGTVLADDPALTARNVPIRRIARRVVIDPSFKLPLNSKLISTLHQAPLTIAVKPAILTSPSAKLKRAQTLGVEFIALTGKPDRFGHHKLASVLRHLARRHRATNVLVEGGPTLLGALFAQGLVDRAMVFIAPKFLLRPPLRLVGSLIKIGKISRLHHLNFNHFSIIGNDLLLDYTMHK